MSSRDEISSAFCGIKTRIELTDELKRILENDHWQIHKNQMLIKLPTSPNVVDILQTFFEEYATMHYNQYLQNRYSTRLVRKIEKAKMLEKVDLCKEVLDGLRIYFDFTLNDHLLYKSEKNRRQTSPASYNVSEMLGINSGKNTGTNAFGNSSRKKTHTRSFYQMQSGDGFKHKNAQDSSFLSKILSWKLVPASVYSQYPYSPSLMYGATHFTRLLAKLPEFLNTSINLPAEKQEILLGFIKLITFHLSAHKEWFAASYYKYK